MSPCCTGEEPEPQEVETCPRYRKRSRSTCSKPGGPGPACPGGGGERARARACACARARAPEDLPAYRGGVRSTEEELVHFLDVGPAKWAGGLLREVAGSATSR